MTDGVVSAQWDTRFDDGPHPRAKVGFIILATDETIQFGAMRLRPEGVGAHFARLDSAVEITVETLTAQVDQLADLAGRLLPDGTLDVVTYACTSGSLLIGEERVFAELRKGAPDAKPTSLITGVIRALRAVAARRLVVATPYLDEINTAEKVYLEESGFEVLDIQGLNLTLDSDMTRVAPDFIAEFALAIDRPDADAIFISCGALRSLEVIDQVEQAAGKPVIGSNQAMIWDTLRLAGIDDRIDGYGSLFRNH